MGSVTVNGEDRLAMFGCTWHDQKTFSLEAFNIVIVVVYGTKMYFNLMCMYGTQKGAYLKLKGTFYETESNLGIWNSNCLHRNEIELYRTRIYLYWIIMHLIGTETFLYVTKTKLF